jgi:hypothetical protein
MSFFKPCSYPIDIKKEAELSAPISIVTASTLLLAGCSPAEPASSSG